MADITEEYENGSVDQNTGVQAIDGTADGSSQLSTIDVANKLGAASSAGSLNSMAQWNAEADYDPNTGSMVDGSQYYGGWDAKADDMSQFDPFNTERSESLDELISQHQTNLSRIGNALVNNVTIAGTTVVDGTAGVILGLGESLAHLDGRYIWNNEVTRAMSAARDYVSQKAFISRGREYEESSFAGKIFSGVFLADLIQNLGYTEGMLLPGMGASTAFGKLAANWGKVGNLVVGKGVPLFIASSSEAAGEAMNHYNEEQQEQLKLATDRYNELRRELLLNPEAENDVIAGKTQEERLNNLETEYLKTIKQQNDDLKSQANTVWALNMAILSISNVTGPYSEALSRGLTGTVTEAERSGMRFIRDGIKKAVKGDAKFSDAIKPKKAWLEGLKYGSKEILEAIPEGLEEISQDWAISAVKCYRPYNHFAYSYLNPDREEKVEQQRHMMDSFFSAALEGIKATVQDEQNWIDFTSGLATGLSGAPGLKRKKDGHLGLGWNGGIVGEVSDAVSNARRQNEFRDKLLQRLESNQYKSFFEGVMRKSLFQEELAEAADKKSYIDFNNTQALSILSDIFSFSDTGNRKLYHALLDETLSNMSDDDIKDQIEKTSKEIPDSPGRYTGPLCYADGNKFSVEDARKRIEQNTNKMQSMLKSYETAIDNLQKQSPELDEMSMKRAAYDLVESSDCDRRINQLVDEIYKADPSIAYSIDGSEKEKKAAIKANLMGSDASNAITSVTIEDHFKNWGTSDGDALAQKVRDIADLSLSQNKYLEDVDRILGDPARSKEREELNAKLAKIEEEFRLRRREASELEQAVDTLVQGVYNGTMTLFEAVSKMPKGAARIFERLASKVDISGAFRVFTNGANGHILEKVKKGLTEKQGRLAEFLVNALTTYTAQSNGRTTMADYENFLRSLISSSTQGSFNLAADEVEETIKAILDQVKYFHRKKQSPLRGRSSSRARRQSSSRDTGGGSRTRTDAPSDKSASPNTQGGGGSNPGAGSREDLGTGITFDTASGTFQDEGLGSIPPGVAADLGLDGAVYRKVEEISEEARETTLKEEAEVLSKIFPQLTKEKVQILRDRFIKLPNGELAWGAFCRQAVYLTADAPRGTLFHEAFHFALHMLAGESYGDIISAARDKYGDDLSSIELEEMMAEDFRRFMENRTLVNRGFWGRIKDFFFDLALMTKAVFTKRKSLDAFFVEMSRGRWAKRKEVAIEKINAEQRTAPEIKKIGNRIFAKKPDGSIVSYLVKPAQSIGGQAQFIKTASVSADKADGWGIVSALAKSNKHDPLAVIANHLRYPQNSKLSEDELIKLVSENYNDVRELRYYLSREADLSIEKIDEADSLLIYLMNEAVNKGLSINDNKTDKQETPSALTEEEGEQQISKYKGPKGVFSIIGPNKLSKEKAESVLGVDDAWIDITKEGVGRFKYKDAAGNEITVYGESANSAAHEFVDMGDAVVVGSYGNIVYFIGATGDRAHPYRLWQMTSDGQSLEVRKKSIGKTVQELVDQVEGVTNTPWEETSQEERDKEAYTEEASQGEGQSPASESQADSQSSSYEVEGDSQQQEAQLSVDLSQSASQMKLEAALNKFFEDQEKILSQGSVDANGVEHNDVSVYNIEGEGEFARVHTVINETKDADNKPSLPKAIGAEIGSIIDTYVRKFFVNDESRKSLFEDIAHALEKDGVSAKGFLFLTEGVKKTFISQLEGALNQFKVETENDGSRIIVASPKGKDLVVSYDFGEEVGHHLQEKFADDEFAKTRSNLRGGKVAGTLDILVAHPDGTVSIYDLKTAKNPQNISPSSTDFYGAKSWAQYQKQLALYKLMFEKKYGIKVKECRILPLAVNRGAKANANGLVPINGVRLYDGMNAKREKENEAIVSPIPVEKEDLPGFSFFIEDKDGTDTQNTKESANLEQQTNIEPNTNDNGIQQGTGGGSREGSGENLSEGEEDDPRSEEAATKETVEANDESRVADGDDNTDVRSNEEVAESEGEDDAGVGSGNSAQNMGRNEPPSVGGHGDDVTDHEKTQTPTSLHSETEAKEEDRDAAKILNLSSEIDKKLERHQITAAKQKVKKVSSKEFRNAIIEAKKVNRNGWMVDVHEESDYDNDVCLLAEDGKSGICITPDGDIISAFSSVSGQHRLEKLMEMAVALGGTHLDCYYLKTKEAIGGLPYICARFGFKVKAVTPFNEEYAGSDYWQWKQENEDVEVAGIAVMYLSVEAKANPIESYSLKNVPNIEEAPLFEDTESEFGYDLALEYAAEQDWFNDRAAEDWQYSANNPNKVELSPVLTENPDYRTELARKVRKEYTNAAGEHVVEWVNNEKYNAQLDPTSPSYDFAYARGYWEAKGLSMPVDPNARRQEPTELTAEQRKKDESFIKETDPAAQELPMPGEIFVGPLEYGQSSLRWNSETGSVPMNPQSYYEKYLKGKSDKEIKETAGKNALKYKKNFEVISGDHDGGIATDGCRVSQTDGFKFVDAGEINVGDEVSVIFYKDATYTLNEEVTEYDQAAGMAKTKKIPVTRYIPFVAKKSGGEWHIVGVIRQTTTKEDGKTREPNVMTKVNDLLNKKVDFNGNSFYVTELKTEVSGFTTGRIRGGQRMTTIADLNNMDGISVTVNFNREAKSTVATVNRNGKRATCVAEAVPVSMYDEQAMKAYDDYAAAQLDEWLKMVRDANPMTEELRRALQKALREKIQGLFRKNGGAAYGVTADFYRVSAESKTWHVSIYNGEPTPPGISKWPSYFGRVNPSINANTTGAQLWKQIMAGRRGFPANVTFRFQGNDAVSSSVAAIRTDDLAPVNCAIKLKNNSAKEMLDRSGVRYEDGTDVLESEVVPGNSEGASSAETSEQQESEIKSDGDGSEPSAQSDQDKQGPTKDDSDLGRSFFRMANDKYTPQNLKKEVDRLSQFLPQFTTEERMEVVKGLIEVAGRGPAAWGQFKDGIITLSDIASAGTLYHEAFHATFRLLATEKEQMAMLADARKKWDEDGLMEEYELEECMAEAFREFMMSRDEQGLGRRIINFFKDLLFKITHYNSYKNSLDGIFREIANANWAGRVPSDESGKIKPLPSDKFRWNNLHKEQKAMVEADFGGKEAWNRLPEGFRTMMTMCR